MTTAITVNNIVSVTHPLPEHHLPPYEKHQGPKEFYIGRARPVKPSRIAAVAAVHREIKRTVEQPVTSTTNQPETLSKRNKTPLQYISSDVVAQFVRRKRSDSQELDHSRMSRSESDIDVLINADIVFDNNNNCKSRESTEFSCDGRHIPTSTSTDSLAEGCIKVSNESIFKTNKKSHRTKQRQLYGGVAQPAIFNHNTDELIDDDQLNLQKQQQQQRRRHPERKAATRHTSNDNITSDRSHQLPRRSILEAVAAAVGNGSGAGGDELDVMLLKEREEKHNPLAVLQKQNNKRFVDKKESRRMGKEQPTDGDGLFKGAGVLGDVQKGSEQARTKSGRKPVLRTRSSGY